MNTGEILGLLLLGNILFWGLADYLLWKYGYQTFSQWVIKEAKKRVRFALAALVIIVGIAIWLVMHFELIAILISHL
jgi:hypothetical protein